MVVFLLKPASSAFTPAFRLRDRRGAFTLLEVLTAMGIFSFAVLGLLHALNVAVDASRDVQRQKMIREQMENRLARLSLPPFKPHSAKADENGVQYIEEIRPEQVKTRDLGLQNGYWRVTVDAEWKERGEPQRWEASHLIWSP
jgi:type II secretory pathway component PulJ